MNIHIVVFRVAWWFITNNAEMHTPRNGTTKQNQQTSRKLCILIQHFIFQVMHTVKKKVELLKYFKIRKLLQHVSVYKETIIREPHPLLS